MSHSVVNSFCKKLRTSCKTDYGISNAVIHLCTKLGSESFLLIWNDVELRLD